MHKIRSNSLHNEVPIDNATATIPLKKMLSNFSSEYNIFVNHPFMSVLLWYVYNFADIYSVAILLVGRVPLTIPGGSI